MKQWLAFALTLTLLTSCEKFGANGRYRTAFIGTYPCYVHHAKYWGVVNAPDSITHFEGLDTVKVYLGDASDEIIVFDHITFVKSAIVAAGGVRHLGIGIIIKPTWNRYGVFRID